MAIYRVGPFELRSDHPGLTCHSKPVPVGAKIAETLLALIEQSNKVARKEALINRIWPGDTVEESNLAQNIYIIRKIFRDHGCANPIETLPGLGYRLTARVDRVVQRDEARSRRGGILRYWPLAVAAGGIVLLLLRLVVVHANVDTAGRSALSQESVRLYAIGRYYWNLRTSTGVSKSLKYFVEVIDNDPESSLGYAGMADAYAAMGDYCYGTHHPSEYFARADAYARVALVLDPDSAPAHATLGFVLMHQNNEPAAMAELRRSIAADPSYAPAHEWYGIALAREGLLKSAWSELELASDLQPLSVSATAWLAELAYRDRRFAQASLYAREVREMVASFGNRRPPRRHPTWAAVEAAGPAAIAP